LITLVFGDKLNAPGLEFGLEGGWNWSDNRGLENNEILRSFNLGFYFDIRLKNQLYLYTGVVVKARMGADKLSQADLDFLQTPIYDGPGDYKQALNYFLLPILAKYKFKNHIFLEGGFQAGWMRYAWVEFYYKDDNQKVQIRDLNRELFNRIDVGASVGLGYKLLKGTGMSIGINYYYGFTNVIKDRAGSNNSSLFLKFNIPVGQAKKEA
jgi:hypothetical protein